MVSTLDLPSHFAVPCTVVTSNNEQCVVQVSLLLQPLEKVSQVSVDVLTGTVVCMRQVASEAEPELRSVFVPKLIRPVH